MNLPFRFRVSFFSLSLDISKCGLRCYLVVFLFLFFLVNAMKINKIKLENRYGFGHFDHFMVQACQTEHVFNTNVFV